MAKKLAPYLVTCAGLALAACGGAAATAKGKSSHDTPPTWINDPSPRPHGNLRCYHDSASDVPTRDEALELARERGINQIVANLGTTVRATSVSYQAETDGKLEVWVGEETIQRSLGNVWDVVERAQYWRSAGTPELYEAHALVCVSQDTYTVMQAELGQLHQRLVALAREKLDAVEAALTAGQPTGVQEPLEAAAKALAEVPPTAGGDLNARLGAAEGRLQSGFAVAPVEAGVVVPAAQQAHQEIRLAVTFEGKPAAELWLDCKLGQGQPCTVEQATNAKGITLARLGPVATLGVKALNLTVGVKLAQSSVPVSDLFLPLPVRPPDNSVMVCGDDAKAVEEISAALRGRGLVALEPQACEAENRATWARVAIAVTSAPHCLFKFGDFECSLKLEASASDLITLDPIAEVAAKRSFIHPKEEEALASARRDTLKKLNKTLADKLTRHVRKVRGKGR